MGTEEVAQKEWSQVGETFEDDDSMARCSDDLDPGALYLPDLRVERWILRTRLPG